MLTVNIDDSFLLNLKKKKKGEYSVNSIKKCSRTYK